MSLVALKGIRDILISDSTLTSIVPSQNIVVGWVNQISSFPTIIIHQTGGEEIGYLGYKTAPSGNRIRREAANIEILVVSRKSRKETLDIADIISPLIIREMSARKFSDAEDFRDDIHAYLKSMTFSFDVFHED